MAPPHPPSPMKKAGAILLSRSGIHGVLPRQAGPQPVYQKPRADGAHTVQTALGMGRYRARDLLLPPSLLSFARVPLAAAFPFVHDRPWAAFGVLLASAASDLLDGWWARRYDQ